jgi:hypothetical protein
MNRFHLGYLDHSRSLYWVGENRVQGGGLWIASWHDCMQRPYANTLQEKEAYLAVAKLKDQWHDAL